MDSEKSTETSVKIIFEDIKNLIEIETAKKRKETRVK